MTTENQQNSVPAENKNEEGENQDQKIVAYRPEGMPDHYLGSTDKDTIDSLYKAVDGFRKQQSKDKGIPENAADYKLDLPEEISKQFLRPDKDGKDPLLDHMRGVFHKRGVASEDAVAIVQELITKIPELRQAADDGGEDLDFEYKSLGGVEKAKPIIDGSVAFINGLKNSGKIDEKAVDELTILTTHPAGLHALQQIRAAMGEKALPIDLQGDVSKTAEKTVEELNQMVADPKYWRDRDPAYIAEVTEGFKKLYANPA